MIRTLRLLFFQYIITFIYLAVLNSPIDLRSNQHSYGINKPLTQPFIEINRKTKGINSFGFFLYLRLLGQLTEVRSYGFQIEYPPRECLFPQHLRQSY